MYGYRRLFIVGLGIFTTASLACGLAPSAIALILARVIQGVGAALMVPQVLTGIQLNFSGAAQSRAIGFYAIALAIGAAAGQVLGGVLISANLFGSGWRPIFLINLPIGALVLIAALRFLPVHRGGKPQRLDFLGMTSLSAAMLLLVLPLILGHTQGWPAWTWISLMSSVIPLATFIVNERRIANQGGQPLINLHVVAQPSVAWPLAAYGASLMTYFSLLFVLALYLQQGLGKSALYSGLALVSWVAAFGIGGPVFPYVPARLARFVAPFGYLLLAASYFSIGAAGLTGHRSGTLLFVLLGFGGLGLGVGGTANIRQITAAAPKRYAPDMSGIITTAAQIAGVLGVAAFGTAYFMLVQQPGLSAVVHGFAIITAGFGLVAVLAAAAASAYTKSVM
jgi:predicted MFS family arabinose efflux permease